MVFSYSQGKIVLVNNVFISKFYSAQRLALGYD